MKAKISNIRPEMRSEIRRAVSLAVEYWPNAGGDETRRQNIRRAFARLRYHRIGEFDRMRRNVCEIANDAYAHADM